MPELPEVEHAARMLRGWLGGRRIERAHADRTRVLRGSDPSAFASALRGRSLEHVDRRGKYLLLTFDRDVGLLSHLGMSGRWLLRAHGESAPSHSRARLFLSGGDVVHYADTRLFGRLTLAANETLLLLPEIAELGPDALVDGVDVKHLASAFARTSRVVKVALMDQTLLAGLGNIHVTETLFRARVHPARSARSLTREEIVAIARAARASIAHALASIDSEEIAYLSDGHATKNPFLVYGREGEPCPRCRTPLATMRIGGRSSAFCPRCQPPAATRSAPRRAR